VFVVDNGYLRGASQILELPAGSSAKVVLPFSGLTNADSIATDSVGDVFVSDWANNKVYELPAGSRTQVVLPFDGLLNPECLASDSFGDLFLVDTGNDRVLELPAGSRTQVVLPFSNGPGALAVDNAGDAFYAEGSLFELPVVSNLPRQ
jgi:serine/threonine-protein kinase